MTSELKADLVLEGGGVKGIGLVGAYTTLADRGYQIQRIAGTSAGAIVGALIAAGMPAAEMEETMRTLDYNSFQDKGFLDRLGRVGQGLSVLFEKGIYEGGVLRDWLDEKLTKREAATFGDLKITDPDSGLPPEQSYRLVVVVSDISRGEMIYLPWDYRRYGLDPDTQRVADAVRASASIPFFYEPVQLPYKDADQTEETLSYLVDGGMLSNYPITIFDRPAGEAPRWPTFGCKLSARPEVLHGTKHNVDGVLSFAKALVGTMMGFHDRMHIDDPAVLARTIFVDTFDVKATDFDIDEKTQIHLYETGQAATTTFLDGDDDNGHEGWDFQRYVAKYRSSPQPPVSSG